VNDLEKEMNESEEESNSTGDNIFDLLKRNLKNKIK